MTEPSVRKPEKFIFDTRESFKVINGDCVDELKDISTNSIDLIVTDPPYKVSQNYGSGLDADNLRNVASILKTFPELCRVLKGGKFLVTFYDNRILPFLFEATKGTELVYRKSIYLYRRWGNANRWLGWMQCTDPICFFVKGHEKSFAPTQIVGKVKHDCYVKKEPERVNTEHPAQKPLELIMDIIRWCSREGDIVLDPYLGSGTVGVAARKLNRKFIGIEIEANYAILSSQRIGKVTNDLQSFMKIGEEGVRLA